MISTPIGDGYFSVRAAGVCVNGGYALLHRAERDAFWFLPGGRVEMQKSAEEALRRELREEMALEARIERLLWVNENFFMGERDGVTPYHELGFYFLVAFDPQAAIYDKSREHLRAEGERRLIFRWFPLDALDDLALYPTFLKTGLRALPESVRHIVHRDGARR